MQLTDLQRKVVDVLERLDVRYFVTGSAATIYYGEPRLTNDLDVVVELDESHIPALIAEFPSSDYYLDPQALRQAIRTRTMVNIIHPELGLKIDLVVADHTPFNASRFDRRRRIRPEESYEAWYTSPEDIILKKMDFYREGGSERHLRDIISMFKVMGASIDKGYISNWVVRLDLTEVWEAVLNRMDQKR